MTAKNRFPPRWDEARVQSVLEHYEGQTDEEALAEDSENRLDSVPLTEAQRNELDRRLDLLGKEGPVGISPEELHKWIKRRTL